MTSPAALGRTAKLRPRDGPEFAQTAAEGQDLVGKQKQAGWHGQGEPMLCARQSVPHGSLRSKLAGDT